MVVLIGHVFGVDSYAVKYKRKRFTEFINNYESDEFYTSFVSTSFTNTMGLLRFYTFKNHNGEYIDKIVEFFKVEIPKMVGDAAFGELRIYDDEGGRTQDEFELYVLKKGKVLKEKDYYFSPYSKEVSPDGIAQM
ncbi:MAG: Imm7 family immunity protein [Saprospiraceae bacterium]